MDSLVRGQGGGRATEASGDRQGKGRRERGRGQTRRDAKGGGLADEVIGAQMVCSKCNNLVQYGIRNKNFLFMHWFSCVWLSASEEMD